jgi:BirA family transcriptional regulator, biotin operon repressor / biotin---[acetyl-CoA-carboxylase] ligase
MGRCRLGSDLLSYLASGSWVSGEEIASNLDVSRAAVWKQVQALRAKGYQIESSTNKGYRLGENQDVLDPEMILKGLETDFVGKDLRYFREVRSTNETAREIAAICGNGTVVLAEVQTKGRGRLSRSWYSPSGGIWMSLVLKPEIPLAQAYRINMAVSVAIARAVFRLYGIKAGIKWPNDLLVSDQKVCGILTEVSAEMDRLKYAVVGIGINANVDENSFPSDWNATSLSMEIGSQISRTKLIQALLMEIEKAYTQMGSRDTYLEWQDRSVTLGRRVRVTFSEGDLVGKAVSLLEDGALGIELTGEPGEIRRIVAGDCVHLRALLS